MKDKTATNPALHINEKIDKLIAKGRVKAIVKDVAGRRFLFGFERLNKRSRKYHIKFLSSPIDLASLSKEAQAKADPAPQPLPPDQPTA